MVVVIVMFEPAPVVVSVIGPLAELTVPEVENERLLVKVMPFDALPLSLNGPKFLMRLFWVKLAPPTELPVKVLR